MGKGKDIDLLGLGVLQTHSFEVTMNYVVSVKNLEPMTDVEELT